MGKIGITGASGFIGNNVVRYLAEKGFKVVAFGKESERNFKHENVEWKILDLNKIYPEDIEGVEKLIHFAGAYNAQDAFSKNVVMLKKILEASHQAEVGRFYLISTYAVFGQRDIPAGTSAPHHPLEAYAMSKVIAEEEFMKFVERGKIKGTIIRPCSLYGKHGKNFVDVIADRTKKGEDIQMVYFRNQFLHVDDCSEEIIKIIKVENPEISYNIEGEIITEQTLKKIFEELGIKYSLMNQKARSYWCKGNKPNINKTVKEYIAEEKNKNAF
jgi:nucleoside-diphosphate-sugar epimerase